MCPFHNLLGFDFKYFYQMIFHWGSLLRTIFFISLFELMILMLNFAKISLLVNAIKKYSIFISPYFSETWRQMDYLAQLFSFKLIVIPFFVECHEDQYRSNHILHYWCYLHAHFKTLINLYHFLLHFQIYFTDTLESHNKSLNPIFICILWNINSSSLLA